MKKAAVILLLVLLTAAFALPGSADMNKYSTVFMDTFDTVISLIGYAENQETFNARADETHAMYLHLHKMFDTYNSYADEGIVSVYDVNLKAASEPVQVDPILFGLLTFCKSHYELVKGQTNVGAVAKGYATELIAQMLLASDMPSFIISAGGNVRMGNPPADGRAKWGVGIQDPDGAVLGLSDIVETLYLTGCSVVTSGDYQRYYVVDGQRYHHLIDPDTLMPDTDFRSVSIITEDSGYADLLSTAAFLMPYEESRAFIDSLDGVEAIWLFPDGSKKMTFGAMNVAKSCGATNQ